VGRILFSFRNARGAKNVVSRGVAETIAGIGTQRGAGDVSSQDVHLQ
jgi:hypothetical protein